MRHTLPLYEPPLKLIIIVSIKGSLQISLELAQLGKLAAGISHGLQGV